MARIDFDLGAHLSGDDYLESLPTLPEGDYSVETPSKVVTLRVVHSYRTEAFPGVTRKWRKSVDEPSKNGDRPGSCLVQTPVVKNGATVWVNLAWLTGQRCNPRPFLKDSPNAKFVTASIKALLAEHEKELVSHSPESDAASVGDTIGDLSA